MKKIGSAKTEQNHKEMSILDHLDELRKYLIRSIVSIVIVAIGVFMFKDLVFDGLILGPKSPNFITYRFFCWLSDALCFAPPEFNLITRELGETFVTHLKVSMYLGLILAFPYVFYQFWSFIKPGLYPKEKKSARGIVFVCSFLFLIGVVFGYLIIAPFAVTFLITYTISGVTNAPTLTSYVGYLVMFTLPIGLVFELPIIIYFLSKVGLVTPELMKKFRRHAIVVILLLSSIITPPDPMTMFLIAGPLYLLYEVSIYISRRVQKKLAEKQD